MELKSKAIGIMAALILLVGTVFVITLNGGLGGLQMKNPLKQVNDGDLSQLYRDAKFEFILPNIVTDGTFGDLISAETVAGTIVQIKMEHASFWATPFINYDADPSGDYNEYPIDNRFITEDKTFYIRYRTNQINKTLLLIKWDSVVYSLVMDSYSSQEELLPKFGIEIGNFVEFTPDMIEDEQSEIPDSTNESNVISSSNDSFKLFSNENLRIQFMIPETSSNVEAIQTKDSDTGLTILSFMCDGGVVFQLRQVMSTDSIEDNGITSRLSDNWVIDKLGVSLENATESQKILIHNIDTIASTFKETQ